ncbi:hypothetical protein OSB04_022554 [Centaurea solstitialis]|uniref:Uncharacterized protein n=1 Tax=Centaurea solstitialis TaxID=347529 RepID=A0AA38WIU4_9ASTR|nr:hypothetical protein OSB04_022554 [Centaurea solstitialis]
MSRMVVGLQAVQRREEQHAAARRRSAARPAAASGDCFVFYLNACLSKDLAGYDSEDVGGFKDAVKTLMEVDGKSNIADIC